MIEFDVMAKDYIKLGFLNEVVVQNNVSFSVFLESEGVEKNFMDIRTDKNVYRFNNFNVSEDAIQNTITFRPIVIGCYSYFKVITSVPLTLDVIKNGTTTVARQFILTVGENKIEFNPQGIQKYKMRLEKCTNELGQTVAQSGTLSVQVNSQETEKMREQLVQSNSSLEADIDNLRTEINVLEEKNKQLVLNKKKLVAHLEKLQAEYNKDYASYVADIEEIKSRFTIDEEILKIYADKEVIPIEELISRSEKDISEIEEQAKNFIEAQQRKTLEIENELKIGRKE